jgi:RHH-type proline utilization regulon transcriptional repressor/proline dehydrogenase/delta 1-pyrroline-5-carboxylate dehydrogenase
VLQFVPCPGGSEGNLLIHHPQVNAVILTGGTATAQAMLRTNPGLDLYAETGGKNATIVTSLADRDQAIKHVLHSAFSHSGQKCSATSLLLLEAEVYDDANFRRTLCAAAASLIVGSAWNLETKMGPLIHPPAGDLDNALKVLQPGEEWALKPRPLEGNPNLWSPGIKYGVSPGSYTHMTEFFGPVLGVMRFRKLGEAIGLVNQTGYGLTSGLESLDEREWDYWKEHIHAGNLYINRVTTGAVVLRQPFGGFGKSVFGPGMKAGGPNYVVQFMNMADSAGPLDSGAVSKPTLAHLCEQLRSRAGALGPEGKGQEARIRAAVLSYQQNFQTEFSIPHDHFLLIGQDNFRRYLPVPAMRVRVHPEDTMFELFARVCAAHTVGSRLTVSIPPNFSSAALKLLEELTEPWAGAIEFLEESDEGLAEAVREHQADRVRYAAPDRVPPVVSQAAAEAGVCLVGKPVLQDGRVELLWYLQEQSLSIDYHRYGNLGSRSGEPRAEPL